MLDIRPLLWRDGWPVAGENFKAGTYEIESARTGTALELAVQGVPVGDLRGRGGRGGPARAAARWTRRSPDRGRDRARSERTASGTDPAAGRRAGVGELAGDAARCAPGAVHGAGPAEVDHHAGRRTPAAIPDRRTSRSRSPGPTARSRRPQSASSSVCPSFTGAPEQLWRIDQLADGTYRLMPKASADAKEPVALSAVGSSTPTLRQFDPQSDRQRWILKTP